MNARTKYIVLSGILIFAILVAYLNVPCLSPKGLGSPDAVMRTLLDSASKDSVNGVCEIVERSSSNEQINESFKIIDVLARDAGGYEHLNYGEPDQGGRGYTYRVTHADSGDVGIVIVHSVHRPWYKQLLQYPFGQSEAYYLALPVHLEMAPVSN